MVEALGFSMQVFGTNPLSVMKNLLALVKHRRIRATLSCLGFLCVTTLPAFAQIVSVTTVQNLRFGAFTQGRSGGTITLSSDGARSATGTVIPLHLGLFYNEAVFEVEASEGTIISLLSSPDVILTGSNGGSMSLQLGTTNPVTPFISTVPPPGKTRVHLGGTLSVGNAAASPPGNYTGSFYITFNNE